MSQLRRFFWIFILLFLVGSLQAYTLKYDGKLVNADSEPITQFRTVTFRLYDSSQPSTAIWEETQTQAQVASPFPGHLSATLGAVTPLEQRFFQAGTVLLGIEIDDGSELTPRVQLAATAHTQRSKRADNAQRFAGRESSDFLQAGQTVTSVTLSDLRISTFNVTQNLSVNTLILQSTLNASAFVGGGQDLSALSADNFVAGELPITHGGLGTSNISAIRQQLSLTQDSATYNRVNTLGRSKARDFQVQNSSGNYVPLQGLAFEDQIPYSGIEALVEIDALDSRFLSQLVPLSGGTVSGSGLVMQASPIRIEAFRTPRFFASPTGSMLGRHLTLNGVTTNRLITRHQGAYHPISEIAFLDQIGSQHLVSSADFRAGMTLGPMFALDRVPVSLMNTQNIRSELRLGRLASENHLTSSHLSLRSLNGHLRLGNISKQDAVTLGQLPPQALFASMNLTSIATQNSLPVSSVNTRNLASSLNLGVLAYLNIVNAQDIATQNLKRTLGLSPLAETNQLSPDKINLRALQAALGLDTLAFETNVTLTQLPVSNLASALGLGPLATANQLGQAQIRAAGIDRPDLYNLGYIATHNRLLTNMMDASNLISGFQIGQIGQLDDIGVRNLASITDFKNDIGLGAIASKSQLVFSDFPGIDQFRADLSIGSVSRLDSVSTDDFDIANLGLDFTALIRKGGDNITRNLSTAGALLINGPGSTTPVIRLSPSGLASSTRLVADRVTASRLILPRDSSFPTLNATQITLADRLIQAGDANIFMPSAPDFPLAFGIRPVQTLFAHNQFKLMQPNRFALISEPRIGLQTTDGSGVLALDQSSTQQQLLLGMTSTAGPRIQLIQQSNGQKTLSVVAGNTLITGTQSGIRVQHPSRENGIQTNGQAIQLETGAHFYGLDINGQVTMNARTLAHMSTRFLDAATLSSPNFSNSLLSEHHISIGNRVTMNPTGRLETAGNITARLVDARTIQVKRPGSSRYTPLGALAYKDSIENSDVSRADLLAALNLDQYVRIDSPSMNGNLVIRGGNLSLYRPAARTGDAPIQTAAFDASAGSGPPIVTVQTIAIGSGSSLRRLFPNFLVGTVSSNRLESNRLFANTFMSPSNAFMIKNDDIYVDKQVSLGTAQSLTGMSLSASDAVLSHKKGNTAMLLGANSGAAVLAFANRDAEKGRLALNSARAALIGPKLNVSAQIPTALTLSLDSSATFRLRSGTTLLATFGIERSDIMVSGETPYTWTIPRGVSFSSIDPSSISDSIVGFTLAQIIAANPTVEKVLRLAMPHSSIVMNDSGALATHGYTYDLNGIYMGFVESDRRFRSIDFAYPINPIGVFFPNGVNIQATIRQTDGQIRANRFEANGGQLTNLNPENILSGTLSRDYGGTGVTSEAALRRLFGADTATLNAQSITVNNQARVAALAVNPVRVLSPAIISGTSNFTGRVHVASDVSMDGAHSQYVPGTTTTNISQNSKIFSQGDELANGRHLPSLYVRNTLNASGGSDPYNLRPTRIETDPAREHVQGGSAIGARSFGSKPTVVAKHYHAEGPVLLAGFKRGGIDLEPSPLADAAISIQGEKTHAIYAHANADKASMHLENHGTGTAFDAQSFGLFPAIVSTSFGDTAIFAMGEVHTSSSKRWKRHIKPLRNSLEPLLSLQGVTYYRTDKTSQKRRIGFIAEDFGQVFPSLVDYEENGVDAKGIAYEKITPILVNAMQIEDAQISSLESRAHYLSQHQKRISSTASEIDYELAQLKFELRQKGR